MNPVLISVVIPTFNRARTLRRAILSVLSQTWDSFELIVVDDGSTDETVSVLQEMKQELLPKQQWTILTQKNSGVSRARNLGASASRGEWIAFLDSDDEWVCDKLNRQMIWSRQHPDVDIIYTDEKWIRNGRVIQKKKKHTKMGGHILLPCLKECFIGCSTVLLKKTLWSDYKGFREDFPVCEDYDLWLKISADHKVGYISEELTLKYGGHADQLSLTKCMDYYRVLAIQDLLKTKSLKAEERLAAIEILLFKCDVLIKGYKKHNRVENLKEVEQIRSRWEGIVGAY